MIRIEDEDGLRRVVLDRPEKANSLTGAMLETLVAAVEGWQGAALVLTGTGGVFSAGADLGEVKTGGLATHPGWVRLSSAIAGFRGLSVVALNGTVAGGALGLVLAADLRIAVPGATLFYPVLKHGLMPPAPDPARLAALAGPSRAARILLAGDRVTVEEALGWGLIDRIVPPEALLVEAEALCTAALVAGPERIAAIRTLYRP